MADAATMTLSAAMLPDEIAVTLDSLTFAYTPADGDDKWFYGLVNVATSSSDLISGSFLSKAAGTSAASSTATIATGDKVKFLFIKNTATTDGSSATNESVYICLDGGTAAYNLGDVLEIGTGESWYGKLTNTTVGDLHAVTGDSNGSSGGEGVVQCIVAAIIDDV